MAKTASLNATNRPGVRCTEGGSCPALPPGARTGASDRTQRVTEVAHALFVGDGITGTSSCEGRDPDRGGQVAVPEAGLRRTLYERRSGLGRGSYAPAARRTMVMA